MILGVRFGEAGAGQQIKEWAAREGIAGRLMIALCDWPQQSAKLR